MSGGARKGSLIRGQAAVRRQTTAAPALDTHAPGGFGLGGVSFTLFIPMLASRAQPGLEHHRLSNAQGGWEGLTGGGPPPH